MPADRGYTDFRERGKGEVPRRTLFGFSVNRGSLLGQLYCLAPSYMQIKGKSLNELLGA